MSQTSRKYLPHLGSIVNSRIFSTKNKINNCILLKNISTSYNLCEKVSFKLSDIGEGIREVVVKEWYIKEGDNVSQFDKICEVQSDKASVTITSRYDGVVTKLYYNVDDTALVGKPLVDLETDSTVSLIADEPPNDVTSTKDTVQRESQIQKAEEDELPEYEISKSVLCIPSVRRLAKEHRVDLSQISGTGKNGRILKEDVLKYLDNSLNLPVTEEKSILLDTKEPIKGFKKAMVKTMTEALKIPHFVYSDEIKVTRLTQLRKELKKSNIETKLTFMPFFIKAASNALKRYPIINSSVDDNCENIIYHSSHNIGVAMDTNAGLVVPIIKSVQNLSIVQIAKELYRLMESGKKGIFVPSDLSGGTFSISNIGTVGGTYTKPVILPPQVSIIAIGVSQVLPRYDESLNIVPEEIINISGSADHRIVDGVTMANFIKTLKRQIENPNLLFLDL